MKELWQSGIVRLLLLLIWVLSHLFFVWQLKNWLWVCPFPAISPITEAACLQEAMAPRPCSVLILHVLITPAPAPISSCVAHVGHCQQHSGMCPGLFRHRQAVVLANNLENSDVPELVFGSCPHPPEEAGFPDSAFVPGQSLKWWTCSGV